MSSKIFGLIALTAIIEQTKAPKNFLYNLLVGEEKPEKVQDLEVHTKEAGKKSTFSRKKTTRSIYRKRLFRSTKS